MSEQFAVPESNSTQENTTTAPMEMCPMAPVCRKMKDKPGSGFLMLVPGLLLVLGGVLVLLMPKALVWLMGGTSILIGIAVLAMAGLVHKVGTQAAERALR